jgi:hypothetical protein
MPKTRQTCLGHRHDWYFYFILVILTHLTSSYYTTTRIMTHITTGNDDSDRQRLSVFSFPSIFLLTIIYI